VLGKTLNAAPENAFAHFLMAGLLFKNRRYQKAVGHLEQSLKLSGLNAEQRDKAKSMLTFS